MEGRSRCAETEVTIKSVQQQSRMLPAYRALSRFALAGFPDEGARRGDGGGELNRMRVELRRPLSRTGRR